MTGVPNPTGDSFDIDYVAHEIGHQMGGYHTTEQVIVEKSGNNSVGSREWILNNGLCWNL
jgi:hypothetical protein